MSLNLHRLLQLASPALPVGAFSYSQGLERAIEEGTVRDEASALAWIGDLLEHNLGRFEAPLLAQLIAAWRENDADAVRLLNELHLASRESAELRAETLQMGYSLVRLLRELAAPIAAEHGDTSSRRKPGSSAQVSVPDSGLRRSDDAGLREMLSQLESLREPCFPAAWSAAAAAWEIPAEEALTAYMWAWAENQAMAALKAVPLGQSAGQRILLELGARLPAIAQRALELEPEAWSNLAPGFAIASCRHETQYSRLFRS